MSKSFTRHQLHGLMGGATQTGTRPVTLSKISFDPKERAMAKRKAKRAKQAKRKASKDTYTVLIAVLEKSVAALNRRVERIEELVLPHDDTPETVAEKARQARDVVTKAADALGG
jgi:hypothetical protein